MFFAIEDSQALHNQQKQDLKKKQKKTRPGADCGSDHKLLIAKFRLKLKKVGKTTRPFKYDLNQILYDYTMVQSSTHSSPCNLSTRSNPLNLFVISTV